MVSTLSIPPQTGGTLDPSHVIGRDDLILELVASSRRGVHHLLTDPRRMGKTAMLIRLCNEPGKNVTALKVDLEGIATAEEAVLRILVAIVDDESLGRRVVEQIKSFLGDVERAGPIELSKSAKATGALPSLRSALERVADGLDDGETLIICLDEVTIAVENLAKRDPNEANRFLQTLRGLRESQPKIAWILTGSVGFHHVLRKAEATEGAVNNLNIVDLGPLSSDDAAELVRALGRGIDRKFHDDAVSQLVAATDGIPFMLHNVAHRLSTGAGPIDVDEAIAACDGYLADPSKSGAWTHLVTRIEPYYPDPDLANRVLDARAISNQATTFRALFDEFRSAAESEIDRDTFLALIDDLVADHYLTHDTFTWRYDVIRHIWMLRRKL